MVGGGCRGLRLARELVAEGHAVRAVTRSEERREEIEAAGCECWIGDPDRIGTLRYALDNVTVLLWLLGTATGPNVADLHGSRLRMMLEKTTDTTVRAVLYEAAGTVPPATLEAGAAELALAHTLNEIPGAVLEADPRDVEAWVAGAREAIEHLLSVGRGSAGLAAAVRPGRRAGGRAGRRPSGPSRPR
jgi:nucleoside-diphosphate-sugar epimerase